MHDTQDRSKCCFVYLLVIFLIGVACEVDARAQRAIPDDNLAYPVLLTLGDGSSGSGFFLNVSDAVYLVTAKHVLFDPQTQLLRNPILRLLSYPKDLTDTTQNRFEINLPVLQQTGGLKPHPSADVVVLKLFEAEDQLSSRSQPVHRTQLRRRARSRPRLPELFMRCRG